MAALTNGFHAAAVSEPRLAPAGPPQEPPAPALLAAATRAAAAFLVRHFADGAIVGPDLRQALLASLGRLLQQRRCLPVFEASAEARALLVRTQGVLLTGWCGAHASPKACSNPPLWSTSDHKCRARCSSTAAWPCSRRSQCEMHHIIMSVVPAEAALLPGRFQGIRAAGGVLPNVGATMHAGSSCTLLGIGRVAVMAGC